jgi:hypothetical protein
MPLKWIRGINPFKNNYFSRLGVGPNTPPVHIDAQAKKLQQKQVSGKPLGLGGQPPEPGTQPLTEFDISDAVKQLREPRPMAEELLLVHAQDEQKEKDWKKLVEKLKQAAEVPVDERPPPLAHPLAVFWFLPAPGPEDAEWPAWDALDLVGPGDPADAVLDIVFDE